MPACLWPGHTEYSACSTKEAGAITAGGGVRVMRGCDSVSNEEITDRKDSTKSSPPHSLLHAGVEVHAGKKGGTHVSHTAYP